MSDTPRPDGAKVRQLTADDWDQLLTIASGFLTLTNGDLTAAMSRALAAHAALIEDVRKGRVSAELPRGVVHLEHHEGDLLLVYERHEASDPGAQERSMPLLGFGVDRAPMRQFEEGITLDRFLMETLASYPGATGTFVSLAQSIALAGKMISSRVNRAGLAGMLGGTGEVNIQGEFVQKLDRYANETFIRALEHRGHTCMVVSEEDDEPVLVGEQWYSGRYVVTVDPLDGSSNIDVNATIGTIFGVYRRNTPEGTRAELSDALRPGSELIAAGYIVYGSGTVMVLGSEAGVHGFTLDPMVGEFFLSHPSIQSQPGKIYSCNEAYANRWQPGVQAFLARCKDRGMSARYIGSLVADFHRNLLKGGVFLYPATQKEPVGKLRLLYEAFPLAYLVERAGGAATDGRTRILDKVPTTLHERTALVIGSKELVEELTTAMQADPSF